MSVEPEGQPRPGVEALDATADPVVDLVARARAESERLIVAARRIAAGDEAGVVLDRAQAMLARLIADPPSEHERRTDLALRISTLLAVAEAARERLNEMDAASPPAGAPEGRGFVGGWRRERNQPMGTPVDHHDQP